MFTVFIRKCRQPPTVLLTAEYRMAVPVAVVGWIPTIRMSRGVISEPPPMPVMPTSTPIPNPKRTIAGSIEVPRAPHRPDFDFPDLLGQECGVRQDTRMKPESGQSQTAVKLPTPAPGVTLSALQHSYGGLQTLATIDLEVAAGDVVGLVGPSGCGKSTLLELICGLRGQTGGRIA